MTTAALSKSPRVYLRAEETERAIRAARMTKGEAARSLGVHASMLSRWLGGYRDLGRDQAAVLAFVLGVALEEIAEDRVTCPHCGGAVAA